MICIEVEETEFSRNHIQSEMFVYRRRLTNDVKG